MKSKNIIIFMLNHWKLTATATLAISILIPSFVVCCSVHLQEFNGKMYKVEKKIIRGQGSAVSGGSFDRYEYNIISKSKNTVEYGRVRLYFSCLWWCCDNPDKLSTASTYYAYIFNSPFTCFNSAFAISANRPPSKFKLWIDTISYVAAWKVPLLIVFALVYMPGQEEWLMRISNYHVEIKCDNIFGFLVVLLIEFL